MKYLKVALLQLMKTLKKEFLPWYSIGMKRLLKQKHYYHRRYKSKGEDFHIASFEQLRRTIKHSEATAYCNYVKMVQTTLTSDPKSYGQFVNNSKRNSTRIPNKCLIA